MPVLVEAERPRENLQQLMEHADYVVTSNTFQQASVMHQLQLGGCLTCCLAVSKQGPACEQLIPSH